MQAHEAAMSHRGGTTVCWLGLFMADATFASSLLQAMPAEQVNPATHRDAVHGAVSMRLKEKAYLT